VVWDSLPLLRQNLRGPDINARVNLDRIATDDLSVQFAGKIETEITFTRAGRANDRNQGGKVGSQSGT
jgi:hypothetical protein